MPLFTQEVGGVGDLPLLFHSNSIGLSKQKGNKGVFTVGEGKEWEGGTSQLL